MKVPVSTVDPFMAIADPNRREILRLLSYESCAINDLVANFEISRPAVSKHIKMLESAGYIRISDVGRERYCVLSQDGFLALQQWIDYFDSFWKSKHKKLELLLKKRMEERD